MLNMQIGPGFFTWMYKRQSYMMYISQHILKKQQAFHNIGVVLGCITVYWYLYPVKRIYGL